MRWPFLLCVLGAALFDDPRLELAAQTPVPVRYTVSFPAPLSHYAEVEAVFPADGRAPLTLYLPVWTPGSYLVREYARNLEDIKAFTADGKPLEIEKTRKNRWSISAGAGSLGESVRVHYRVYCREMTVRTNWVDENFALLNGAATFLTLADRVPRVQEVAVHLPAAWKTSISGMRETAPNQFEAPDYDTLVDSPILAGNPTIHEFEVGGKKHYLANQGETPLWDGRRAALDTQKIVEQNLALWGSLPYDKYVFLNLIVDSGGGLEHKNSFTIMSGRYATRTHKSYLGWLGLVSHEYFHAWNVKRLRPIELGPFDYENEVYTSNLWIAEGFTDYYSGLMVRRAGLATEAEYLGSAPATGLWGDSLSAHIEALQTTPGRLAQPVSMASYDAWIKAYRPDENSVNTAISYYTKGSVIAWLLDAKLRHATHGRASLEDLMRLAYARYSGEHGYTTPQFIALAGEIAGDGTLPAWFHNALDTTNELDYAEALDWFGLEFKKPDAAKSDLGALDGHAKAWTGLQTRVAAGRLTVTQIPRESPGAQAGMGVDDEILAVDGWRVNPDGWAQRLEQYAPGDTVELLISRRDRIVPVRVTLGAEPATHWQLQKLPHASAAQERALAAWLAPLEVNASEPLPTRQ